MYSAHIIDVASEIGSDRLQGVDHFALTLWSMLLVPTVAAASFSGYKGYSLSKSYKATAGLAAVGGLVGFSIGATMAFGWGRKQFL
jgi:hypothetical protein